MAFILQIGGVDFTKYVATNGFEWERNDIDAPNSGRDMAGTMRRAIITTKDKISVTCRDGLTESQLSTLVRTLAANEVTVTYYCPGDAATRTANFYGSKVSAGVVQDVGNRRLFDGIKFNLIEV